MTQRNATAEDVFERARAEFFGTVKKSTNIFDEPATPVASKDKPATKEVAVHALAVTK